MQLALSVTDLPLDRIEPHPEHDRAFLDPEGHRRLLASIRRFGLIRPLLVVSATDGRYRILDGHRRYHCASSLGMASVVCRILPPMTKGEYEVERFMLHDTVKPWTKGDLTRWRRRAKALGVEPIPAV